MKNKQLIIVLSVVCCVLLLIVGYTILNDKKEDINDTNDPVQTDFVIVDGVKYKPNRNLQTVLFIGVDKQAKSETENRPGENGQGDSLNLLIADRETKKAQIMQISRDTMVDIDIYSASGEKVMTEQGQITLQYAYGEDDNMGSRLITDKVSELLYGVDIQSYLSLTMEGMVRTADAIGGITITIPEDYTDIDPLFEKDTTITMDGTLVEKYVRSRDADALDSNVGRMKRQQQFMSALIEKLKDMQDSSQYMNLYKEMEPYMATNMTAEEIVMLSDYEIDPETVEVPGEIILKDGHAQFIVDNEELQKIILKIFYKCN